MGDPFSNNWMLSSELVSQRSAGNDDTKVVPKKQVNAILTWKHKQQEIKIPLPNFFLEERTQPGLSPREEGTASLSRNQYDEAWG